MGSRETSSKAPACSLAPKDIPNSVAAQGPYVPIHWTGQQGGPETHRRGTPEHTTRGPTPPRGSTPTSASDLGLE